MKTTHVAEPRCLVLYPENIRLKNNVVAGAFDRPGPGITEAVFELEGERVFAGNFRWALTFGRGAVGTRFALAVSALAAPIRVTKSLLGGRKVG